jgi:hypothetical protein
MSKLIKLNESFKEDATIIDEIVNNEITVFEDIQGAKIFVNWDGDTFAIKPKSIHNYPINLVDLAMQKYYTKAFQFFSKFDDRVKSLMNKNWWFCFEYFPDNQPSNITYDIVPKNNLVLVSISKKAGSKFKFDYTIDELVEYANLFDVDSLPVIFQGKLPDNAIEAIKYFLNTSPEDLEFVFGEKSFSFFFYKLLNPLSEKSFLMEDDFQKNIEKLIIRVGETDNSFELLNPLYKKISDENSTEYVEVYTLILFNFLTYCQSTNIEEIKLKGNNREELYIYLICRLFNMYVTDCKDDLINFDFVIPKFFSQEKFKINSNLIKNKVTKELISENQKLEYIFKIILGSFNKKRKHPIGVLTEITIKIFNDFVDKISRIVDESMNKYHETELSQTGLLNFSDYFDIKYDSDGDNQVYPDVYTELDISRDSKKKKGGKKK